MPYAVSVPLSNQYTVPIKFERDITDELRKTFTHGRDLIHCYDNHGLPIDPDIVPRRAYIQTKAKRLMDFIRLRFRLGVTEEFRRKVEELEPGVHQFIPVEIFTRDGEPVEKSYYLMNICHRVDAINEEKSILRWTKFPGVEERYRCHGDGVPEGYNEENWDYKSYRLVFKKELIAGMCMWIDRRYYQNWFVSDELFEFAQKEKIKKLDGWKVYAE